tara:strand:- start:938 stop:2293 length:1356 start_codon:yes stop_codon:yes gene_type:complete
MEKNLKTKIEFVNHASVLISFENISILSDPWYKGHAFNKGWRLIYENENQKIIDVLNKTTHIYISHEHPDHFRTDFFKNPQILEILLKKKIKILFQKTLDKRVVNFLSKLGLEIIELSSGEKTKLNEKLEIRIIRFGLYDSSILIKTPHESILNINDCALYEKKEIIKFKKKYGSIDVLLKQFSYASGFFVHSKKLRMEDAKERLNNIEKIAENLNCKNIIPFASFIHFSNESNFFLNDSINTPDIVKDYFSNKKYNVVIFSPGEVQETDNLKQNANSLNFWREKYKSIDQKIKDKYDTSINFSDLNNEFLKYQKRIFKINSKNLINIIYKLNFLKFFQPLIIKLSDHNEIYTYTIFKGLVPVKNKNNIKPDITMHSQMLHFIFKFEFGFDTLTVNGCFQTDQKGLEKAIKSLSIEILNSMGLKFNLKLIFNFKLIYYFFKNLNSLKKKNV